MLRAIIIYMVIFSGIINSDGQAAGDDYAQQRQQMVDVQIARRGVNDKAVLEAMCKVPRHLFVPEGSRREAYTDHPLPIGQGQTISQPYIVAFMSEAAQFKPTDKVLEIGTGSGYQAAILAEIVEKVYTIEIVPELGRGAEQRLAEIGYDNIFVRIGDGYKGWPEQAPFDVIIVTAAPEQIPEALVAQLKIGGKMIVPVGAHTQELIRITRTEEGMNQESLLPVRFVPMVHGNR